MIEAKWKTVYAGGAHDIGESDIAEIEGKIIIKSSTIPTASADTLGEVRQYVGASAGAYTHGYIYECTSTTVPTATILLEPHKIVFDDGNLVAFFEAAGDTSHEVVSGRFKYYETGDIWNINGLDENGNTVFSNYQVYTQDLVDAGFVLIVPITDIADEEEITYDLTYGEQTVYSWARIDVQPDATRGRFLSLWNCATGLPLSNPASSPYEYATGDYFIVSNVDSTTNYKPSGTSYTTGVASTTVETIDVKVDDTYYFDGTNWRLQQNVSPVGYEMTANKVISISNASTDTQYPSAKCVYDALAYKQDSSTAVTHTASTAAGNSTTPVYIAADGTATAISYSIEKSVPSNAAFTDTTYSVFSGANGSTAGTSGLVPAPTATDNVKFLKGDGTWATTPTPTVDQSYNSASSNAQSGVAIAGAGFQTTSNLVTSLSSLSTDTQYPSAKCVYDIVGDIESLLATV